MKILLILAGLSSALALTQNAALREILVEVQCNLIIATVSVPLSDLPGTA